MWRLTLPLSAATGVTLVLLLYGTTFTRKGPDLLLAANVTMPHRSVAVKLPSGLVRGVYGSLGNVANTTTTTTMGKHKVLNRTDDLSDSYADRSIFLAANLFNCSELLPHWMSALQGTLAALISRNAPPQNLFVSIYESGSTDSTPEQLTAVLAPALDGLGVKHSIVVGGDDKSFAAIPWETMSNEFRIIGGNMASYAMGVQSRVQRLAEIRNRALAPLLTSTIDYTDLVFINDVYFAPGDVLRLLMWRSSGIATKADLACGLDFVNKGANSEVEHHGSPWGDDTLCSNEQQTCVSRPKMAFYDAWVSRDSQAKYFKNRYPFVQTKSDAERIEQGLPIPATCCWNGAVVLDPKFF
jgi:hypothetical protein